MDETPAGPDEAAAEEPVSYRPSGGVFALAFAAVALGGLFGAMIGAGLADVGCEESCGSTVAVGGLLGALVGGGGVAVVAVLVLRAMAEWDRRPPERFE